LKLIRQLQNPNSFHYYSKNWKHECEISKGKSSLSKEEYLTIYSDIFDISDSNNFVYSFYKAVAKSFKNDIQSILQTLKNIFSRATFRATVTSNGEVEFKLSLAHQREKYRSSFTKLYPKY
jgi:hypothetical protein